MRILLHLLAPFCALLIAPTAPAMAQQEVPLWTGAAKGSEGWTFTEKSTAGQNGGRIITDVVTPTLTVYLPKSGTSNGTAVIIAPGGAMSMLAVASYETGAAKWLNDRGIAAFLLKYRVLPTPWRTKVPVPPITEYKRGNANPFPNDERLKQVIGMAIADAQQALRIVRRNAVSWGIDPAKVGFLGYSAGGGVAMGAAVTPADRNARPDFVISAYGPSLIDVNVPANPPPIFLAVKQNHPNVARALVALYQEWTNAGAPAELHIYDPIGQSYLLDDAGDWLQRAYEWMIKRNLVRTGSTGS
jgi:predicted esterase